MKVRLAVLLLAAITLGAQTSSSPVEAGAERHHHLLFENAYVRVALLAVPPGDATLLLRYRHDFVSVSLCSCQTSTQVEGKPPLTAKLQEGETTFTSGNVATVIRNTGSTLFRSVTVELMQDAKARSSPPPPWDEERGLEVLDGGTKEILFVKDGVRVSETELQPHGKIGRHHHAGPHLTVALTDLNLRSDVPGKPPSIITVKAGGIKWVPGGFSHTVMNQSQQPARYITLEFH